MAQLEYCKTCRHPAVLNSDGDCRFCAATPNKRPPALQLEWGGKTFTFANAAEARAKGFQVQ